MTVLSRFTNELKHILDSFRKRDTKTAKKVKKIRGKTDIELAKDLLSTLRSKKESLIEERKKIHQKIREIDEKFKKGKISVDVRDDRILKLLKKGVKLRKQIEKISREINRLETST